MRDKSCLSLLLTPFCLVTLVFVMAACEGDPGPEGPAGQSGTANCIAKCHTDDFEMQDYIMDVRTAFAESQHNTGDTYVRRGSVNSPTCSGCHTTEGYQYRVANNGATIALESSSRIGCFACHAPHTNETFALRKQGATDLFRDGAGAYDKGNSNTCAMCHQAQAPSPALDSPDPIESEYWGPHHGPQSNMLSGQGAHVLPGASYPSNHPHNSIASGCVNCHMAALPEDGLAGGHSYRMEYEYHGSDHINDKGCDAPTCHQGVDMTAKVATTQTAFATALDQLATDMVTLGWLDADKANIDPAGAPTDPDQRGAIYNYLMLLEDRSNGVHNSVYMNSVLSTTQSFVTDLLP